MANDTVHPHDLGLPVGTVRKRRKSRYVAHWMLVVSFVTAAPGWTLYVLSVRNAHRLTGDAPLLVIAAYVLLIVSSITLVLGIWYLLVAQVRRIATMVGEEEVLDESGHAVAKPLCGNCGWFYDPPDRFCRHCGKALGNGAKADGK